MTRRGRKATRVGIFRRAIFPRVNVTSDVITRSLPLLNPCRAAGSPSQRIAVGKNYRQLVGQLSSVLLLIFAFFSFFLSFSFLFSPFFGSSFHLEIRAEGYLLGRLRNYSPKAFRRKKKLLNSLSGISAWDLPLSVTHSPLLSLFYLASAPAH